MQGGMKRLLPPWGRKLAGDSFTLLRDKRQFDFFAFLRPFDHFSGIAPRLPRICNQISRMVCRILVCTDNGQPFGHGFLPLRVQRSIKPLRQIHFSFSRVIGQKENQTNCRVGCFQLYHRPGCHAIKCTAPAHQKLNNAIQQNVLFHKFQQHRVNLSRRIPMPDEKASIIFQNLHQSFWVRFVSLRPITRQQKLTSIADNILFQYSIR